MSNNTVDPEEDDANIEVEHVADIGGTIAGQTSTSTAENELPNDGNDTGGENDKEERGISLQELIYGAASFHAVVKPGKKHLDYVLLS